jgi:hypothetical protein
VIMTMSTDNCTPGMTSSELQRECGESRKERQIMLQVTSLH